MVMVRADIDGLSALATECVRQVDVISSASAVPVKGCSFQATAAAVSAAHAEVLAKGARLIARMQSTADDLTLAAHEYEMTETGSAIALSSMQSVGS